MAVMTSPVRTADQAAKDAVVFKALANAVRLQIVSYVAASEEGQVAAGEIVDRFDLSQPTISHHLRVLREAGVLTTHKASTYVYYRFAPTLHEVVTAVLPRAAAAEPPATTEPARRSAGTARRRAGEPQQAASAAPAKTKRPKVKPEKGPGVKKNGKGKAETAKGAKKSKDKKNKKNKK